MDTIPDHLPKCIELALVLDGHNWRTRTSQRFYAAGMWGSINEADSALDMVDWPAIRPKERPCSLYWQALMRCFPGSFRVHQFYPVLWF